MKEYRNVYSWVLQSWLAAFFLAQTVYAQSADIRVNQDASGAGRNQNETTIAINPTNPNNVVAGSNYIYPGVDYRQAYYRSTDAGGTWTEGLLPLGGAYDKSGYGGPDDPIDTYFVDPRGPIVPEVCCPLLRAPPFFPSPFSGPPAKAKA